MIKDGCKFLTVEQLAELLKKVPPGSLLYVNKVGNLGVANDKGVYLGYVDFALPGVEICGGRTP